MSLYLAPYEIADIILFLGPAAPSFSSSVSPTPGLLPFHSLHPSTFSDVFTIGTTPYAHAGLPTSRSGNTDSKQSPLLNTGEKNSQTLKLRNTTLSYATVRDTRNGLSIIKKQNLINLHTGRHMFIYHLPRLDGLAWLIWCYKAAIVNYIKDVYTSFRHELFRLSHCIRPTSKYCLMK